MNQDKLLLLILGALALASLTSYMVYNHQQQQQQADSNPLSSFGFLDSQDLTLRAALFRNWMIEHEKQYSDAELTQRFVIWNKNYDIVQEHNAKNLSWELETNKFADLTDEEFVALYTGYIPDNVSVEQEQQAEISEEEEEEEEEEMESSESKLQEENIDWRDKKAVTNVKDQGQCGGCYAFAGAGAIEGLARLNGGTQESLSPQQIIDCSGSYGNQGCNGGNFKPTFNYAAAKGLTTEKIYPYRGAAQKCTYKESSSVYKIRGSTAVKQRSGVALYNAIKKQPVVVAVAAASNAFKLYKKGVISSGCGTRLDHAVLLVGYEKGGKDWIIKNSWGTGWGEKGYVRIKRRTLQGICGINSDAHYPTK